MWFLELAEGVTSKQRGKKAALLVLPSRWVLTALGHMGKQNPSISLQLLPGLCNSFLSVAPS